MAVKKSELYSSIWKSCDELRGGMDASQYKDYVLVLLFMKYVSDKYIGKPYSPITIPEGGGFADMVALKGKSNIGEGINTVIKALAGANNLRGVIDTADFDDTSKLGEGKDQVERLTNLIAIFENPALDFSRNRAADDDLLGDAYEYLMRNFATQSGKSKGQFYTPAEVSQIMAQIIGLQDVTRPDTTLYDPTCGSGSLLLKGADVVPADAGITIYGQENDTSTRALAQMNMILHGNPSAVIQRGNTLSNPLFTNDGRLDTFDFALANPPFSHKSWSNGITPEDDPYQRFIFGVPPTKNGDYAFLSHFIRSLKSTGKGAIILPHGVLFRGNVEAEIRRNIIERGYIKGIFGLPANLFYGTGIPACIIVIDKEGARGRDGIFMVDASKGYVKDGNKNRLRYRDVHQIVDAFNHQIEVPRYSRRVPYAEIERNEFNLNIPRYIDTTEPEDIQDIEAHLRGGIPNRDLEALGAYWDVFPTMANDLFQANERDGYSDLRVELNAIKRTIFEHPEFRAYSDEVAAVYDGWRTANMPRLEGIQPGDNPKVLITAISEDALQRFADVPLINNYSVYQHLMLYWSEVMQDDVYVLVVDGWTAAKNLRQLVKTGKKYTEDHDFEVNKKRYKADHIPPALMIARYFSDEQARIDQLTAQLEATSAEMTELEEEHGGEDGLLAEVTNDKGNVTKGALKRRLQELAPDDADDADELALLTRYQTLVDAESDLKVQVKDAETTRYTALIAHYPTLTEDAVKGLVVADKWLAQIEAGVASELDRVSATLANRIQQLAERYANPLPELQARVQHHRQRVNEHLKRMGYDV